MIPKVSPTAWVLSFDLPLVGRAPRLLGLSAKADRPTKAKTPNAKLGVKEKPRIVALKSFQ